MPNSNCSIDYLFHKDIQVLSALKLVTSLAALSTLAHQFLVLLCTKPNVENTLPKPVVEHAIELGSA